MGYQYSLRVIWYAEIIQCKRTSPSFDDRCDIYIICYRLQTLGGMQASDELDDNQIRQLLHDLDSAFASFNNFLHNQ